MVLTTLNEGLWEHRYTGKYVSGNHSESWHWVNTDLEMRPAPHWAVWTQSVHNYCRLSTVVRTLWEWISYLVWGKLLMADSGGQHILRGDLWLSDMSLGVALLRAKCLIILHPERVWGSVCWCAMWGGKGEWNNSVMHRPHIFLSGQKWHSYWCACIIQNLNYIT